MKRDYSTKILLTWMSMILLIDPLAQATSSLECEEARSSPYPETYDLCQKQQIAIASAAAGVPCDECNQPVQQKSSSALEWAGVLAAPLAFGLSNIGSALIGAKAQRDVSRNMANAYITGQQECTNRFNMGVTNNTQMGANPFSGSELASMNNCSAGGGQYAGTLGLAYNGYGGYGNPMGAAGYSSGFLNGMIGPYGGGNIGFNPYGNVGALAAYGTIGAALPSFGAQIGFNGQAGAGAYPYGATIGAYPSYGTGAYINPAFSGQAGFNAQIGTGAAAYPYPYPYGYGYNPALNGQAGFNAQVGLGVGAYPYGYNPGQAQIGVGAYPYGYNPALNGQVGFNAQIGTGAYPYGYNPALNGQAGFNAQVGVGAYPYGYNQGQAQIGVGAYPYGYNQGQAQIGVGAYPYGPGAYNASAYGPNMYNGAAGVGIGPNYPNNGGYWGATAGYSGGSGYGVQGMSSDYYNQQSQQMQMQMAMQGQAQAGMSRMQGNDMINGQAQAALGANFVNARNDLYGMNGAGQFGAAPYAVGNLGGQAQFGAQAQYSAQGQFNFQP